MLGTLGLGVPSGGRFPPTVGSRDEEVCGRARRTQACLPEPELQPYIGSYRFTRPSAIDPIEELVPPGWGCLHVVLASDGPRALLFGPTSRCLRLDGHPPAPTIRVHLMPLGWSHLIARPASAFADCPGPVAGVFPGDAAGLLRRLRDASDIAASRSVLDSFFRAAAAARPAPDAVLLRASELLLDPGTRTAAQLAAGIGRSGRQLARLSLETFGFPPKLLLRRQRFLRTLVAMRAQPDEPWVTLLDEAYCDQSHFARDCHRFTGLSPSAFFEARSRQSPTTSWRSLEQKAIAA